MHATDVLGDRGAVHGAELDVHLFGGRNGPSDSEPKEGKGSEGSYQQYGNGEI